MIEVSALKPSIKFFTNFAESTLEKKFTFLYSQSCLFRFYLAQKIPGTFKLLEANA
jgi:hypothetical protein